MDDIVPLIANGRGPRWPGLIVVGVAKLEGSFGAQVDDIVLSDALDASFARRLVDALHAHRVLVIPDRSRRCFSERPVEQCFHVERHRVQARAG